MSVPDSSVYPSTSAACSIATDTEVIDAAVTVVQMDPLSSNTRPKTTSKRCWILIAFLSLLAVVGIVVGALAATGKLGNSTSGDNTSSSTDDEQPLSEDEYKQRYANFRAILIGHSEFSDPNTPQSKALNWLVYKDTTVPDDESGERLLQRYALMVIFYACSGADWTGFLTPLDAQHDISECLFRGIKCNDEGSITSLEWFSQRMAGRLPDEIGLLRNLIILNFSDNMLEGAIPGVILTKLTNLNGLYLDYNEFTSTIGSEIAKLVKLEEFQVDSNYLTGSLPSTMTTLNLRVLGLSGNRLTGPILDMIPSWNNLEFFLVDQNDFTGTIPEAIGDLRNLRTFSLFQTQVSGFLPESMEKLTKLETLDLAYASFLDTFPSFIGSLTNLEFLAFSETAGTGTLPSSIGMLKNLKRLELDYNENMYGSLPSELGNLVQLEFISITMNRFTGSIPLGLAKATNLHRAGFADNGEMSGSIDHLCFIDGILEWDCDFTCDCCKRGCS